MMKLTYIAMCIYTRKARQPHIAFHYRQFIMQTIFFTAALICLAGISTDAFPSEHKVPEYVVCTQVSQIMHEPTDCAVYYLCDANMIPQYMHCVSGLYFDPHYSGCNYIDRVTCTNGVRPLPIPSATPATFIPGPQPVCQRPSDLYGSCMGYTYCQYYWKCSAQGIAQPFICPPDLHFDHFNNMCTPIGVANCEVDCVRE